MLMLLIIIFLFYYYKFRQYCNGVFIRMQLLSMLIVQVGLHVLYPVAVLQSVFNLRLGVHCGFSQHLQSRDTTNASSLAADIWCLSLFARPLEHSCRRLIGLE